MVAVTIKKSDPRCSYPKGACQQLRKEIESLKAMIVEVRELMQKTAMINASKEALDFYTKTENIRGD